MSGPSSQLGHAIVRAGAGAGKTRGLVEKVVDVYRHFARAGESPRLVLTTFTRKATQELKERLILKACAERDPGLLQFVSDPARLQISTIHGLLNVFLRQVGHLAGLDAGFQIVGESDASHLARLALREAIVRDERNLVWLESYGFERVLRMCRAFADATYEHGAIRPATLEQLEALADREVERWRSWLGELANEIREEVDDPAWSEYANSLRLFLSTWDGDAGALSGLPSKPRRSKKQAAFEPWHERVEEAIGTFKKEMGKECWMKAHWPKMTDAWASLVPLAESYVHLTRTLKEDEARYQMADLEYKSAEILRAKPFLGDVFAEGWDFWMIDEYQDTSPLQVEILSALIGNRPKYVVGDPQQSIYLFRGAEVRVFEDAERFVQASGGEIRELRRNYRSQPDLLLFMNDFMQSLGPAFLPMEPRVPAESPSRVCAHLLRAPDGDAELHAVIARVAELLGAGARLEQICILGRTHKTLMDVSRALKDFGYPTHVHSSRGFSDRREVMDAQALWKFLVNPHDNQNLLSLLRSPWFYVGDDQLVAYMATRPRSLWQELKRFTDEEVPEGVVRLREAAAAVRERGLTRVFEETLLSAAMLDLALANDPAGRKESNLWKLIAKARALEKEGGFSALDFLDAATTADPLEATEGDATSAQEPGCINLMTIHGAKGLEFEHVILPRMGEAPRTSQTAPFGTTDGRFHFPYWCEEQNEFIASPLDASNAREQKARELEEFDRWLYVALTRAKGTLTLLWSEKSRESWAERSHWCGLPEGRVERGSYVFEVRESWPEPTRFESRETTVSTVRPVWRIDGREGDERQAVTDLIAAPNAPKASVLPKDLLRRWEAQSVGTKLHRRLEALRYNRPWPIEDAASRFVLGLEQPPVAKLVCEGQTEWGFQIQTFSGVIEGQIDLWGKIDGRLYVVDYKSGSPKRIEDAFTQLEIYAWALRRFGHPEPAELVVLYPLAEKFETRAFSDELFARWEREFGGA